MPYRPSACPGTGRTREATAAEVSNASTDAGYGNVALPSGPVTAPRTRGEMHGAVLSRTVM